MASTPPPPPTREEIDDFLRSHHTMRLATIRDGGGGDAGGGATPHVVPVWYMYENGAFYVGTHTKTAKARNIAGGAERVAFCVDTGVHSPDIFGVSGYGTAQLLTEDIAEPAVRILEKYYDDVGASAEAQQLLADTDCIIRITPTRMTGWRY